MLARSLDLDSPAHIVSVAAVPPDACDWHELETRRLGPRAFQTTRPVAYHIGGKPSPLDAVLVVPAGRVCDLSSVPRWLPGRYSDLLDPAGLIHDELLGCHLAGYPERMAHRVVEPTVAHAIFLEAARATPGTPRLVAHLGAFAVRLFGLLTLNRKVRASNAGPPTR